MPFSVPRWCGALAVAAAVVVPASVRAEPYLAVRQGLSCASCHLNRTGGGARTVYGAGFGRQTLPWKKLPDAGDPFDGVLTERVRLGADLRTQYLGTLQDPGPYVGEYRIGEANLYLGVDLIQERVTLYVDEHL